MTDNGKPESVMWLRYEGEAEEEIENLLSS